MEVGLFWKSRSVRDCSAWEGAGGGEGGEHINTMRGETRSYLLH
jgi:hypothetical protein